MKKKNNYDGIIKLTMCMLIMVNIIGFMISLNTYHKAFPHLLFLRMNYFQFLKLFLSSCILMFTLNLLSRNIILEDYLEDISYRNVIFITLINLFVALFYFIYELEKSSIIDSLISTLTILLITISITIFSFVKFKR